MAEFTLESVLHSLVYPTTIRISSGSLTAEEGKHFRPFNVLTLYGNGLRVYVPPSDNAALRERCRTADTTERTRRTSDDIVAIDEEYTNVNNLFTKNIFISEKANIKDNKFAGKVYRDAAELLSDSPFSVRANKSFFACSGNNSNEMRKISEGEVICLSPVMDADVNILCGHVNGERVSTYLSHTSLDVTALPDPNSTATVRPAAHIMQMDIRLPIEMVFEDKDVQETYQIEVGFNVIPLREPPIQAVCCSTRYQSNDIKELDNDMLKINNVWCFNLSENVVKTVKVQVLHTDRESAFKPAFGKEVGRDENEFSLYNLYAKVCSYDYVEPTAPRRPQGNTEANNAPPPLPERNPPPPLPIRASRRSVTLRNLPRAPPPPTEQIYPSLPPNPEVHPQPSSQASSPTFVKSRSQDDRPIDGSVHRMPDLGASNSTDEEKMSPEPKCPPRDEVFHSTQSDEDNEQEMDTSFIKNMTISDVAKLFRQHNLDNVADVCEEQSIDGVLLLELDEEDLKMDPFNLKGMFFKKAKMIIKGHIPKK